MQVISPFRFTPKSNGPSVGASSYLRRTRARRARLRPRSQCSDRHESGHEIDGFSVTGSVADASERMATRRMGWIRSLRTSQSREVASTTGPPLTDQAAPE